MEELRYLFDTCILVDLFRGKDITQGRFHELGVKQCCTATICLCELYAGAFKHGRESEFKAIDWLKDKIPVIPFDDSFITYGRIRAELEKQGRRLEDIDLLLASVAIDNDLTLVTGNRKHFDRIPDLKLEVWD